MPGEKCTCPPDEDKGTPARPATCSRCEKPKPTRKGKAHEGPTKGGRKGQTQRKTKLTPPPDAIVAGQLNTSRYLLDSRRGLHEQHSELYAHCERLTKAVAELEASVKANPPRWKDYEPPAAVHDEETPSGELPEREGLRTNLDLLANAFGVMTLRDARKTQYHGWNALGEYILRLNDPPSSPSAHRTPPSIPSLSPSSSSTSSSSLPSSSDIPPDIFFLHLQFPCPPPQPSPSLLPFLPLLPPRPQALQLLENYYTYFTWSASPVPLSDLREIFHIFYPPPPSHLLHASTHAHMLALLFGAFLLGTLYDFENEKSVREMEAERWLKLLRAAVACEPILRDNGGVVHPREEAKGRGILVGIQAMVLMTWYLRLSPTPTDRTFQWTLSGYISKLVQSIGLYRNGRDPNLFIQDEEQIRRAEQTFWEYHAQDIWNSYMYGRPPSMPNEFIQCCWPTNVEVHPGHATDYFTWKFSFSSLLAEVMNTTASEDPVYEDILREDKRLRAHDVPKGLEWPRVAPGEENWPGFPEGEAIGRTFQRWVVASLQNIALMYLHRPFAWRAISGAEEITWRHRYWRSTASVYHTAANIVTNTRRVWQTYHQVTSRIAPFWSHTLSAAFALGVIAVYKPNCQFARGALMHFDEAVDMFVSAGEDLNHLSVQRQKLVAIQRHAHAAFRQQQIRLINISALTASALPVRQEGNESDKQPRTHVFHITGDVEQPLSNEMPPEYEVYRRQETGWDHLISKLEMRGS